jgi:GT2 family glycosyltransferase
VISDNASTDGTEAICRRYAVADPRIRYVRRATNIGGPRNFCYVFSLCTGSYVKWTTADDFSDPRFLEEAVAVLDARPDVVLCFPRTRIVDADGQPVEDHDDNLELSDDSPRHRFRELYEDPGLAARLFVRGDVMGRTGLMADHQASMSNSPRDGAARRFHMLPEVRFFAASTGASSWARSD